LLSGHLMVVHPFCVCDHTLINWTLVH